MITTLVGGKRDPKVLAEFARASMRRKIPRLEEVCAGLSLGTFDDHHRFLLARMLAQIDAVAVDRSILVIIWHFLADSDQVLRYRRRPR